MDSVIIASLLEKRDFKSIGDKFYLPNSSKRPSRIISYPLNGSTGTINLPVPLDSLHKKFTESVKLLQSIEENNNWKVSSLQPVLNLSREFFNETVEFFGLESTTVEQGEWLLRAAASNYIFIGLLISRAGEIEIDGDERIGEVFHSIKKCLGTMNKKDEGKRPIIIFLFAECFRLMFKLKRLGLFPSLLTSVQVLGAEKLLSRARKSDAVQFLFYRALYEFHGQRFKESWERFKETWGLLHPDDLIHRRRVATYLIAIGLCHGKGPVRGFLRKYGLENELGALCDAIMTGNSKSFHLELSSKSSPLHHLNIYTFLVLNGEAAVQLNLIKRTWKLGGKNKIVSFAQIKKVAEFMGMDVNEVPSDELECILINLIGKKWIRGQLNHENQVLILNAMEPFSTILV